MWTGVAKNKKAQIERPSTYDQENVAGNIVKRSLLILIWPRFSRRIE
jgi:hypothetical protein